MGVVRRTLIGVLTGAVLLLGLPVLTAGAASAAGPTTQPVPGHTSLVPATPRKDTPFIGDGEIWDVAVVASLHRVFIAGTFTTIQNTTGPNQTAIRQAGLASYDYDTGLVDTSFRPTFGGGGVNAVEATPDGTKLFVAGTFNTVNGVAEQKVASLDLTTGAPLSSFGFAKSTNNGANALAASNTTLYVGGRFSRINGVLMSGLAAVDASTGAVDTGFDNQISGGIGVDGALTVQQLKLTHDNSKLLVVHTGRQVAGQDRLGMAWIDTQTKHLLPWRSRLWDGNLARVGGVTRIYAADIAPDDSYFVVTAGSGGDAPPISDTAVAFPVDGQDDVQPRWVARCFDSVYSVAITERAVYIGGHFSWNESPTADQPWPGLTNVGYGTGQGLSGYGLGDQVVRRDHLGALDPATGTALEWYPISNSFEGNKAMVATARGLFTAGDANIQGSVRTGRVAFFDFNAVQPSTTDTTITLPIEGRVEQSGVPFPVTGTATAPGAGVTAVQVDIQNRDTNRYLQADGATWGTTDYKFAATLDAGTTTRTWHLDGVTLTGNQPVQVMAKAIGSGGASDPTKAVKKIESFQLDDQTPATTITGPSGIQTSTSFTLTGTATDDHGVNSLSYWFRDDQNRYLQADGTVDDVFHTFSGLPDVVGAPNATWSYDVTLPHEGVWRASATARDTAGQDDLRSGTRDITVDAGAVAPTVAISSPTTMTPPFAAPTFTVTPGQPITFAGTASDDDGLRNVEITLRNSSTREALGADGTWGVGVSAGYYRVSPVDISGSTYGWTYTTPFNLSAGTYSFTVRATDDSGLTTSSANQGRLTVQAQVAGDNPPNALVDLGGTQPATSADVPLTGTATDDFGVPSVQLTVFDNDTGRYLQDDGSMSSTYNTVDTTLAAPGATSTTWSYALHLPTSGSFSVTALGFDTAGQQDPSTTGATARYTYYPGDAPPGFTDLGQPVDGSTFGGGKIVVTGRALDDVAIANVDVAVVNAAGQYMSSAGTFTSTTPSFRAAFLNSPGSQGSNYSYTTPVIPAGTYQVQVRGTDNHGQVSNPLRIANGVTVTQPANTAPTAVPAVSCDQNVCSFDGRGSTDENPTALTYAWSYGTNQGTGTGPVPVKTYTAPGTYTVTLTVKDEWGVSSAPATLTVVVTEPTGNQPPTPTFASSCTGLGCSVNSAGTTDPNTGDTITDTWSWGDGTATTTGATSTHTYATPGSYVVTMTATDGWGKAASTTRTLTLTAPGSNRAPVATFTTNCTNLVCATNSTGTADPDGDALKYSWSWGDGTAAATTASPSHTYAAGGTYTIVLTATDIWNVATTASRTVTVAPAQAGSPTAAMGVPVCTGLSCTFDGSASTSPNGPVTAYTWDFGDGTPAQSGPTATTTHAFAATGSYDVKLTVADGTGASASVTRGVSVQAPATKQIAWRGGAAKAGNSAKPKVSVPGSVVAGDVLVLALSANTGTSVTGPAGWTSLGTRADGTDLVSQVWTKVAVAADAGKAVQPALGATSKWTLSLGAYSGVDTSGGVAGAVAGSASAAEAGNTAAHSTPTAGGAATGNWLVSFVADKATTTPGTTAWSVPGQSVRSAVAGSGAGHVSAVLVDATGGAGGVTATANSASSKAVMWSVVLKHA